MAPLTFAMLCRCKYRMNHVTITKNDDSCMCSAVLHDVHNIIPPMQYNAIHAMPMQCQVLLCSGRPLIITEDLTNT